MVDMRVTGGRSIRSGLIEALSWSGTLGGQPGVTSVWTLASTRLAKKKHFDNRQVEKGVRSRRSKTGTETQGCGLVHSELIHRDGPS